MIEGRIPDSFRDPDGFMFVREGRLYRQVNRRGAADFRQLADSGLLEALLAERLLVPHREASLALATDGDAAAVIAPETIPFISYPYEWCFSQLKEAALATLRIQSLALDRGMVLKDASAYNVQFRDGGPVLIDTLSFTAYHEGEPWAAYGQFCRHFLAPLALMALRDVRLGGLLREHLDGVPLDLAAGLLPWRTRLRPRLLMHVHAHAASMRRHARLPAGRQGGRRPAKVSRAALVAIVDSLRRAVADLHWRPGGTTWGDYYADTNYSAAALAGKKALVATFLEAAGDGTVWDLGANNGLFSRLAAARGRFVVSADADPAAVELNWRACRRDGERLVLPLLVDLANPGPAQGWAHVERRSLLGRGPAGIVMALALVHHLAIGNNVPLAAIARFLAEAGGHLIVEFVPKTDSQVRRLLASRPDVFTDYDEPGFRAAFGTVYDILREERVPESERVLFLMRRRVHG